MNWERDLGEGQGSLEGSLLSRASHHPIPDPNPPHMPHGDPPLPRTQLLSGHGNDGAGIPNYLARGGRGRVRQLLLTNMIDAR